MKAGDFYCWVIAFCYSISSASSQTSSVGNGSSIGPSAGQLENYGINGLQSVRAESAFPTRHYRLQGTGIGSSFIGTTSPTSESTPATKSVAPLPARVAAPQFRLPKLDSTFPDTNNPAMQTFTPAVPRQPHTSALSSHVYKSTSFDSNSFGLGLETLPSFASGRSMTDQMQFDSFNSFR